MEAPKKKKKKKQTKQFYHLYIFFCLIFFSFFCMYDWLRDIYVLYLRKKINNTGKQTTKQKLALGFFSYSLRFLKSFYIRFALTELFFLVGNPAGGPATEQCLAAAGAALTAKAPSKDTPPPSSLLGFSKDPPRSRIGSCRLPGPGDD